MSYSVADRNRDFVNFAEAFAGWVSANFRAIHFTALDVDRFHCKVYLRSESAEDRTAIDEALGDFEAMRQPAYDAAYSINCEIVVSLEQIQHVEYPTLRLLHLRDQE